MPGSAIEVRGLTKVYGDVAAVNRIDLDVRRGEVFGFLGPNGAGKTATMKMLLGLTRPTAGQVRFDGLDIATHGPRIRAATGYLPERVAFYPNLTAMQTLQFFAELRGVDPAECGKVLEQVGLAAMGDVRVGTFSQGMVQLLGVAQALLGSPKFVILDEPTAGLDPRSARAVKDRLFAAATKGATVFFSSHLLGEVQEIAARVAILNRGKLVAQDSIEALGRRLPTRPKIRFRLSQDASGGARIVEDLPGVSGTWAHGNELVVECDEETKAQVVARLVAVGIAILGMRTEDPNLEQLFLDLTGPGAGAVR